MKKLTLLLGLVAATCMSHVASAQDTVKYGTAVRMSPVYYLPVLAAQEHGFFKKNNLSVEWLPSQSGPDLQRNLASNVVDMGSSLVATDVQAIGRGAPSVIVANLQTADNFAVWVASSSRFQKLQDLAGAKFGVSRLSGAEHAYGLLVANQLGLKDAQFIGTGGIRESLAVLTTGSVDALILAPQNLIELKLSGKVRRLAWVSEYLPKPWVSYTVVASKRMIESHPEVVKRTVASLMAANKFLMSAEGKPWAIAKMKEVSKYSDRGAEEVYESLSLQSDGKLEKQSLQNVSSFMTEYGLLKDGEAPNIDTLFTNQFVQ